MERTSRDTLWTKDFLVDTGINFLVYLIYYLLIVIIAVVAKDQLHATMAEAGLASGIFIVGTMIARLLVGQQIELIGRRKMLYGGLAIYFITTVMYLYIPNLWVMYAIRLLNGVGYGVMSTATNTIIASCIPLSRRGEGINYYGLSTSIAAAVGPFIGMVMLLYTSFDRIIEFCVALLFLCIVGCFILKVDEVDLTPEERERISKFTLHNFVEFKVVGISIVAFFMGFSYSSVLAFLAAYAQEINLAQASTLFFVVYAVVITISRPMTGIIFDRKGENYVMYPCFISLAIGLLLLSFTNGATILLLAGVFVGLGYGTFMSNGQAICIKLSADYRMGVAISTYFVALDLGLGISPYILGDLRPVINFEGVYQLCALVAVACLVMYYFLHDRKQKVEKAHIPTAELVPPCDRKTV